MWDFGKGIPTSKYTLPRYHFPDDEYQAELKISPFFLKQHSFTLDPELEERIKEKENLCLSTIVE